MKKFLAILAALSVIGLVFLSANPASAAKPADFSYKNMAAITYDNGKPSQWTRAVSSPEVRTLLTRNWIVKKLNTPKLEGRMKREAVHFNASYTELRDIYVCEIAHRLYSRQYDRCISSIDGRYDNYNYFIDNNNIRITYVYKGQAARSDENL